MREAIHFLKYHNHQAVAALLAKLLAEAYRRYALTINLIIPVPLHKSRLKERGYNQSELLARQLGYLLDLQVNSAILRRIRKTEAQVSLSRLERPANVADAFECNHHLSGQHVLLIDDVCTTGSTLDACAKALKARGADLVWGLTLARA
jgi:ComF family protein